MKKRKGIFPLKQRLKGLAYRHYVECSDDVKDFWNNHVKILDYKVDKKSKTDSILLEIIYNRYTNSTSRTQWCIGVFKLDSKLDRIGMGMKHYYNRSEVNKKWEEVKFEIDNKNE